MPPDPPVATNQPTASTNQPTATMNHPDAATICTDVALLSSLLSYEQRLKVLNHHQLYDLLRHLRQDFPGMPALSADELEKKVVPRERLSGVLSGDGGDLPLSVKILRLLNHRQLRAIASEIDGMAGVRLRVLTSELVLKKEQYISALTIPQRHYLEAHMPGLLQLEESKCLTQLRLADEFSPDVIRKIHETLIQVLVNAMPEVDAPQQVNHDAGGGNGAPVVSGPEQEPDEQHKKEADPASENDSDREETIDKTRIPVYEQMGYHSSNAAGYKFDRRVAVKALTGAPNRLKLVNQLEWTSLDTSVQNAIVEKVHQALPAHNLELCRRLVCQIIRPLPTGTLHPKKKRRIDSPNA
ncbi:hypothetical protein BZA05DRAFT_411326 [Tricharina praecox]|uniref:uncharacterized protein n=1 Tax=Tricharina praecox TaxID=43433 RepID=UPI00221FD66E|nr:uncharacterized protein BZA05DRAFT_411326 [Tricharina praecox]KAI5843163.1 hypothetical protein BZA05DRAFT_411326 [Tricharina praecox]